MDLDFGRHDMESISEDTAELRRFRAQRRAAMRLKLTAYRTLLQRIKRLKKLRDQLERDLLSPLGSTRLKHAPTRSAGTVSDPVSAPVIRLDDLQDKIMQQLEEAQKVLFRLMCAIEFLPPDSQERDVIELHYLDGKTLREIEQLRYISQATIVRAEARGIDALLQSEEVCAMLNIDQP